MSVSIGNDYQATSLENGPPIVVDWLRPPANLHISVRGAEALYKYRSPTEKAEDWVSFPATKQVLKGPLNKLLQAMDAFREKQEHTTYLDDFDDDFEARLKAYDPTSWPRGRERSSSQRHAQQWESIAKSGELLALATRGYLLFDEVFPKSEPTLRALVEGLEPGSFFDVFWPDDAESQVPNLPWALMYLEDPDQAGRIDPTKFFGLRFRLSYRAYQVDFRSLSLGDAKSTYCGHAYYWSSDASDKTLQEANWQRAIWKQHEQHVLTPMDSAANPKEEVRTLLRKAQPGPMSVIYLYCKCRITDSEEPELYFGNPPKPDVTLTELELPRDQFDDHPLVFCNACSSSQALGPYSSNPLERLFFKRSCSAFLGTVEKTPIRLASHFASAFFQFFRHGIQGRLVSSGEAVTQARLFLWSAYNNIGGLFYTYLNEFELYSASDEELRTGEKKQQ